MSSSLLRDFRVSTENLEHFRNAICVQITIIFFYAVIADYYKTNSILCHEQLYATFIPYFTPLFSRAFRYHLTVMENIHCLLLIKKKKTTRVNAVEMKNVCKVHTR